MARLMFCTDLLLASIRSITHQSVCLSFLDFCAMLLRVSYVDALTVQIDSLFSTGFHTLICCSTTSVLVWCIVRSITILTKTRTTTEWSSCMSERSWLGTYCKTTAPRHMAVANDCHYHCHYYFHNSSIYRLICIMSRNCENAHHVLKLLLLSN